VICHSLESERRYLESDPDAINFNTAVNYATNVYHGTADLFRVGSGVGNAIYNPCSDDPLGDVLRDVGRGSSIALMLAGPAAGIVGGGSVSLAGRGGTLALEPMADAAFKTGTVSNLAGYQVAGNAGLVGEIYNVNVWGLYATENSQGLASLMNALRSQARAVGASEISITGNAIRNPAIQNLSPAVAGRFGFGVTQVNSTTIVLRGGVH
jgi:hypothetical protein